MPRNKNRFYTLLLLLCLGGAAWLAVNISVPTASKTKEIEVCLIKHVSGIPCPSCGSTRAAISILQGDFWKGFNLNPLGFLILLIICITPVWILFDFYKKEDSLMVFYGKMEVFLKKPKFAFPSLLLILTNWIWNIYKGI